MLRRNILIAREFYEIFALPSGAADPYDRDTLAYRTASFAVPPSQAGRDEHGAPTFRNHHDIAPREFRHASPATPHR